MRFVAIIVMGLALCLARGAGASEAGTGRLGAELRATTKEEADRLGWQAPRGAVVVKPVPGGVADVAGLAAGDILILLDGVQIDSPEALNEALDKKPFRATIRMTLRRGDREKRTIFALDTRLARDNDTLAGKDEPAPPPAEPNAATPDPDAVQLKLDTGGHLGMINDIAFTPDGRQLVSASDDKTIRVWDLATGKAVRIIRGASEAGDGGKIYAMALSPDGKWLAAGGWLTGEPADRDAVRLFDFASGRLVALLKGHDQPVLGLAFSPDGTALVSGSGDGTAIVWTVATHQLKHRLTGHRDPVSAVAFTPDGERVVTGSFDHDLRLWQISDGSALAVMAGHKFTVDSLAVASNGMIASGDLSGEIRLWDGQSGAFRQTLASQGSAAGSLSFSPDGALLMSGAAGGPYLCRVFDVASAKEIGHYAGHDNAVLATAVSPDGRWAATGGGNSNDIQLWDLRNQDARRGPGGKALRLGGQGQPVWSVGFSSDGKKLAWGQVSEGIADGPAINRRGPLQQAIPLPSDQSSLLLPQRLASPDSAPGDEFVRAVTRSGEWSLSHRGGGQFGYAANLDITERGQVVKSIRRDESNGGVHRAYTFSPDGSMIISGGGQGVITAYDRLGSPLGDFTGHDGDVLALAPSPDGRFLLSGADDQTARLWNLKTRELLVTIFQGNGEWAMWTPQGYYAASGPGADLIGWQINHGPDQLADYVTAAQIRKSMNRPDIVSRAIQLGSAEAAVKDARGTNFKLADLLAKPVPRLRITAPAANATLSGGTAEIAAGLEATPDPVRLIRIHVNGRQVAEHLPSQGGGFAPGPLTFKAPLTEGANTIRLVATNESGETSADVTVMHSGAGDLDKRGTLYILAIGVDKYPKMPGNDLRYSGADAKAFAGAMERRAGAMHERVVKRVLTNAGSRSDAPTAANILDALGMLRQMRETDTLMMFVAGHGINEGASYRFLPTDARQDNGNLVPSTIVPWYAFQEAMETAKGRRILFIDTCHAGNSYNQRLTNDSYQANILVYSAARWDQQAMERADLGGGHGLFTYATIEGIEGRAASGGAGGPVTALALRDFLVARVGELAKPLNHAQEPQYFRGRDAEDYVLARGTAAR